MISEISVARKVKHVQVQALKDACYTRMGGNCGKTDRSELCKLCPIDYDIAKMRSHFEGRFNPKLEDSKL